MIRESSSKQQKLSAFDWPFAGVLDENNRWVRLAYVIPWDELSQAYHRHLNSGRGRPSVDARVVIGAVIIKHKLSLSDRETVGQIQENPYMQYFLGYESFNSKKPFDPSLFVKIRRRMGDGIFEDFTQTIIDEISDAKSGKRKSPSTSTDDTGSDGDSDTEVNEEAAADDEQVADETSQPNQGKLIMDATVADQYVRYPTDVSLLNEVREFCEKIIDLLFDDLKKAGKIQGKKPRSYRQNARRDYLAVAKKRKPGTKAIRKGVKQQLQYVRRDLKHIEVLLNHYPYGSRLPLPNWLLRRYWVIPHLYDQQKQMYDSREKRCDDRIVSISQPWIRPIVRSKQNRSTEFGAKLNVSMNEDGIASVDHFDWNAFNESQDLIAQVEAYKVRYGHYPEVVLADQIYGTRDNRAYLKNLGIRFGGKKLGRPRKKTEANAEELKAEKKQRQEDHRQRIPIEGKFGQGKAGYRLNEIRAKRSDTSQAWVGGIFFVMNLLVLQAVLFCRFLLPQGIKSLREMLYRALCGVCVADPSRAAQMKPS